MKRVGRQGYDAVSIVVPGTVPYVRHSSRGAHWFAARALAALLEVSGFGMMVYDRGLCSGAAIMEGIR